MNAARIAISGFAAGAAVMYFSDPDRGKRRRALVRDQSRRMANRFVRLLDKARRDTANRAEGMLHAVEAPFRKYSADDQVIVQRVRAHLGRLVSHPRAIEVSSDHGNVELRGLILESEVANVLRCVPAIPGVVEVQNRLEIHSSSEHVPSLQGGVRRESRSEFMQQNWTPSLRIAAGSLGGALIYYGIRKHDAFASAGGVMGAVLLTRAICNRELRDIIGASGDVRVVDIDKAIHLRAPVEEVFRMWSDFEKLPSFMTHLREVSDLGQGRSHWVAEGPGGIPVSWDADLTEYVPNKLLAWRSVPGSTIESQGTVRFDPDPNGGTRVGIRMFYRPPAGVLGHYAASLLGADPKSEMDDDLVRFKSLLETGKTRAHGARVSRESLSF